jgi:hypothetical protein
MMLVMDNVKRGEERRYEIPGIGDGREAHTHLE